MKRKLYYGAAYYPELWDEKKVEEDIIWMKKACINVVRIGEFAWSTLEPHQDMFHVDFFVDVIKQLHRNKIETIICTPTATPPIWVSHNHPERMLVDGNGVTMSHGGRQQVCTNNPFLRERASIIIHKLAKVYGSMPGVIGWQIDNELKGNVSECYCKTCMGLWHQWLKKKYGSIEVLNNSWGTHIWSQYYESFEQVPQPFKTPAGHSPSLTSAYRLFSHERTAEFVDEQVKDIRKHSDLPITHNSSMNHYIDNERTFKELNFASFDHYSQSKDYNQFLTYIDTFKTLKWPEPFWVMETSSGFSGNGYGYQSIHKNQYLNAEVAAAYANGAGGFCYWLWRQQRSGFEQTHGSIINSWGLPSVTFQNVVEAGKLKNKLEHAFANTVPVQGDIAVTYSDRARAFFMSENLESSCANYVGRMMQWHQMVLKAGYNMGFIFENNSFEGCKLLMTPFMPHVSEDYQQRAIGFVENGGIWIVGPVTGIRTAEHTIHTDFALGNLENLAGVRTVFQYPMTGSGAVGTAFGRSAPLTLWSSVFECRGAEEVGKTEGGVTPGVPFITEYKVGKGKIVMLGSMPEGDEGEQMLVKMLQHYAEEAGALVPPQMAPGTIAIPRSGVNLLQWVIINMDGNGGEVIAPATCKDTFLGDEFKKGSVIKVAPYDCRVIDIHKTA